MAVGHYQFEAIHPFTDGNGRTGRILNLLYLTSADLLPIPVLYMSRYIIQTKAEYYRLLLDVTRKDAWEDWIVYMLGAVAQTSIWTLRKVLAVRDLRQRVKAKIQREAPKIYSAELVDQIFEQPYCRISNLVESKVAQRQTASVYLKKLAELDLLKEVAVGRERIFVNTGFFKILSASERIEGEQKAPERKLKSRVD
jgi:Fic family protein